MYTTSHSPSSVASGAASETIELATVEELLEMPVLGGTLILVATLETPEALEEALLLLVGTSVEAPLYALRMAS